MFYICFENLLFMKLIITFIIFIFLGKLNAQTLVSDHSLNSTDTIGYNPERRLNNSIDVLKVQNDGKIFIGGSFTSYNGIVKNGIARVHPNGNLDFSFIASNSDIDTVYTNGFWGGTVKAVDIQANGRYLVGGSFMAFNNSTVNRICRLNIDGSSDASFNIGSGPNNTVKKIVIQPDGKIIVVGDFTIFNGVSVSGIVRLNSNGSIDNSFDMNIIGQNINDIKVQADGKILVAGYITNPMVYGGLLRFNSDGSLDSSFSLLQTTNSSVIQIPDFEFQGTKLIAIGDFSNVIGVGNYLKLIRLNNDGSIDNSFNTGTGLNGEAMNLLVNGNGDIFITPTPFSGFSNYNGNGCYHALLNPDGSYKLDFEGQCFGASGYSVVEFSESGILCASSNSNYLLQMNFNGSADVSFNKESGFNNRVNVIKQLPDGSMLVGGNFTGYNNQPCNHVAHLFPNGDLDTNFNSNIGIGATGSPTCGPYETLNFGVNDIIVLPNNKYVIGGSFTHFNGQQINSSVLRLNSDGTRDLTFISSNFIGQNDVRKMAVLPSGEIFVGSGNQFSRLFSDGFYDFTFGTFYVNPSIEDIKIQADGKIVIVGGLYINLPSGSPNNYATHGVSRLNSNGTFDLTFHNSVGSGANGLTNSNVYSAQVQQDGKIILGGLFSNFNGTACQSLIRLNNDGTTDGTFNTSIGDSILINNVLITENNDVVIAGNFDLTQYELFGFKRLDSVGNSQSTWDKPNSLYHYVDQTMPNQYERIILSNQIDNKILMGGLFTSYDGEIENRMLRLGICQTSQSDQFVTEQFQYTWPVNGITYFSSGNYLDTTYSIMGCDSIVTLHLTITDLSFSGFVTPSDVDSCNGIVYITTSGTGGFTYDIGNGQIYSSPSGSLIIDSLCQGIYSITIMDGNGDSLVSTFVIPTDSSNLLVNPYDTTTVINDSITILIENCILDYNSIDTIYLDSYFLLNGDSIALIFAAVDMNGIHLDSVVLEIPNGNNYVQCQYYCPTKNIDKLFVFTFGLSRDNGSVSTAGLNEHELSNISLFPNPTSDIVTITMSAPSANLRIYDIQGKLVAEQKVVSGSEVSLNEFQTGVYLFEVISEGNRTVKRVVKN